MGSHHRPGRSLADRRFTTSRLDTDTHRADLPRPLTSFVGRRDEIAEIHNLLMRDDVRLVTLTGPGGSGKTRLAIEVARHLPADIAEDVWFVSLAAVRDPDLVLAALSQAIGVRQMSNRPAEETLIRVLRERRALLVVDNFETVTEAAPRISSLLATCPFLKVMVTSREILRISGEHVYAVPPFPLPAPSGPLATIPLQENDAVQLFVQRAQASASTFELADDNATSVVEICRRLEGLPLAIELAAARISMLSPSTLLRLLQRQLSVLTDGPMDAEERHRSMRNAIAWSYDLLPDQEQAAFRRLAVFTGGFTLRAAESIVTDSETMLDTLAALAAKSLLVPIRSADQEPGFTMLAPLREYGMEELKASGEESEVRNRHAAWFLTIAEESDFAWCMPLGEGLARIRRLDIDQGNIRAALAWLRQSGDLATCLHMAAQLGTLWTVMGNTDEGQRWLEELLDSSRSGEHPLVRAKGLAILSWISNQQGNMAKALALSEEGLSLYRTHDHAVGIIQCLILSGVAAARVEHLRNTAVERDQEAIARMKALDEPAWIVNLITIELVQLATIALLHGEMDEAEVLLDEGWRLQRGKRPRFLYGNGLLLWAGHLARARSDHVAALEHYRQSLDLARQGFHIKTSLASLAGVAGALAGLGQDLAAARLFGASEALHEMYGIPFKWETFDIQRALGLPEPWAQEDQSFGVAQALHNALEPRPSRIGSSALDPAARARAWEAGRKLSLEEAIAEALDPAMSDHLALPDERHDMTPRQLEVLRLVAEGKSNRAIAETLSLSERTVEHHVTHILDRLGLESRTGAAAYAVREGLL